MNSFIQTLTLFSISIIIFVYGNDPLFFPEDTLKDSHGRIIYSSVIFRHGERTPVFQYPSNPYNKKESYWQTYWPQGKGQLTKMGKLQAYNLGKWFRERYGSLMGERSYRYDFLNVHTSDYDRTIMSATCFLAGFIPPSPNETWTNDGLNWQPVPVRAIPRHLDAVISCRINCERYKQEEDMINRSPEMQDYYFKHREIFNFTEVHSGVDMSSNNIVKTLFNAYLLYDILSIEKMYNFTLPAWTRSIYPEPLKTMATFSVSLMSYSHQMRRLKTGILLGKLIDEMESKIRGKLNATFHFYGGHESTISGILIALEMFNDIIPPPSSSVFIELRQKNEDYVVTILYKNTTTSAPYFLQVPGCEYVCTLEKFKKLTENLIPQNWQEECNVNEQGKNARGKEDGYKFRPQKIHP